MHHQAGVNFENFTEVKFGDNLLTGMGHRNRRLNRDSPGQAYGRSNLNQNLKPKSNFRFIRERPFAISSFYQKCRPPKSAAPGHWPPAALVGSLPPNCMANWTSALSLRNCHSHVVLSNHFLSACYVQLISYFQF